LSYTFMSAFWLEATMNSMESPGLISNVVDGAKNLAIKPAFGGYTSY